MNERRPGQVEVVASGLIINPEGKILLYQGPKWGDKWLIPGGHVDYRETLKDAAVREVLEETGLETTATRCINVGNLIDDPNFNRATQLVFFHFLCESDGSTPKGDPTEITELKWFTPEEALQLSRGSSLEQTINNFLNGVDIPLDEYKFPPRD